MQHVAGLSAVNDRPQPLPLLLIDILRHPCRLIAGTGAIAVSKRFGSHIPIYKATLENIIFTNICF